MKKRHVSAFLAFTRPQSITKFGGLCPSFVGVHLNGPVCMSTCAATQASYADRGVVPPAQAAYSGLTA